MTPLLAASAVLLAFAAVRELSGSDLAARLARRLRAGLPRGVSGAGPEQLSRRLGAAERIQRAGIEHRITLRGFLLLKGAGAAAGLIFGLSAAPVAPGRLAPLVLCGLIAAGFIAPDAWAERIARRRRTAIVAALPDALDLVAVGASAGRSPASLLGEVASAGPEPLASELAVALAGVDCGGTLASELRTMRRRVPGPELGALAAALERSRQHGSPLAGQLHDQAASLRVDARRRTSDHAAKAAPKIQLVIALVLVPSVLLVIAAALISHSDVLFAGLR
jgi:tight adherence protein C